MSSIDCNMRTRVSGLPSGLAFLLALVLPVLAAEERLSPASLSAWQASGQPATVEAASGRITLPADAQLVRSYPAGRVTVRLVSRPFFHAGLDSSPLLEVGAAAITFVQNGTGGGVVLLGDTALTLPQAITLGPDGRSVAPLDLRLEYDHADNEATLLIDGTSHKLDATTTDDEVIVAVSAGGQATWTLDLLEVRSNPAAAGSDGSRAKSGSTPGAGGSVESGTAPDAKAPMAAAASKRAFAEALAFFKAGNFAAGELALFRTNRHRPGTLGWQLESAGKLTQMALRLRQEYALKAAVRVARRGIEILQEAEKLARRARPAQRASVHEMAAFLHDEMLHDEPAARAEFEKAKLAVPHSLRSRNGLERLDEDKKKTERLSRSGRRTAP